MEGTDRLSVYLQVLVDFLGASKGALDEYLCQTVGLFACNQSLTEGIISTKHTSCCAMMARL